MKLLLTLSALILSVSVIAGCKPAHDPAKWYLTGYESGKLLIQHDHKLYTAKCFESFGPGRKVADSPPRCSYMLEAPGLGNEIPLKSWVSMTDFAYYTPSGDEGPQYHLIFDSIKENGK